MKVIYKKHESIYALKEMKTVKVIYRQFLKRELLLKINYSFLLSLSFSLQDNEYLYLEIGLLNGEDFWYHIYPHKKFTEKQIRK